MFLRTLILPLLAVAAGLLTARAETLSASLIQTSGDPAIGTGKFYGYRLPWEGPGDDALEKAQMFAATKHVPLVVIWSEEDCEHCNDFILELNGKVAEVSEFLSTNRAVFTFFKADTPDDDIPQPSYTPKVVYDAYRFATTTCGGRTPFPVFGFYFEKGDGTIARGGTLSGFKNRDWAGFKKLYLNWLANNDIELDYYGGRFVASDTAYDRYEAEATTEWVDVELVRETANAFGGVTNLVVAVWPDGTVSTNAVEWAEGATALDVRMEIPAGKFAVDEVAELLLYDQGGALRGKHAIHFVSKANTNDNPLWIGEREADTLAFGEWTMDLDVATNKVAAFDGAAYTLVSVQGSLWCPDCGNVDRNFMDIEDGKGDNRFRAWAASHNVALVAIDIPNYNGPTVNDCASPSLLSRDAYATAIARPKEWPDSGADAALTNKMLRSGRPYLSRKMVPAIEADAIRTRNHFLVSTNTPFGGFHRPEDGKKNRTGVPIFVLLRKDGTVAARMTRFASVSPMAAEREKWDDYIKRCDEMLTIATSDAAEIENNHWTTTAETVASGVPVKGTISHADTADWFEITGAEARAPAYFGLSGDSTNKVTLSVGAVIDGTFTTVGRASGPLKGLSLRVELPVAERWFAGVTCQNTDDGFTVGSPVSTLADYSLDSLVSPPSEDPGEIAFADRSLRISEFSGTGTVSVVRRGGNAGATSVRIVRIASDPADEGRYVWVDRELSWANGETGTREIDIPLLPNEEYEGAGSFVLKIEKVDCPSFVAEDATCEVTIIDTDAPCLASSVYEIPAYMNFGSVTAFRLVNRGADDTQVTVAMASGTLPDGMKIAYDRASGEVVLSGVPKKAGTYTFVCAVSARRAGKRLIGFETEITVTVADPAETNPLVAEKRPAQTLPLFAEDGAGVRRLVGTVNVAVTSKGAISAKYSGTEGKAISFAGNWQSLDESGAAHASLTAKGATLALTMAVDGRLSLALDLPADANWFAAGNTFTAEAGWPQTDVFDAFKGYYTVALPQVGVVAATNIPTGGAILTLNMAGDTAVKNGTVRFAGVLPDGTPVSGSTAISRLAEIPDYDSFAEVPVFVRTAKNVLGAALTVDANGAAKWDSDESFVDGSGNGWLSREIVRGAEDVETYVLHRGTVLSYETRHDAHGSYYVPGVSPTVLDSFYEAPAGYDPGAPFALAFDVSPVAASERYGAISPLPEFLVRAGVKTLTLDKTSECSFSFSARTGVFKGTARFVFEGGRTANGTFSGVLTPGWVLPCACGIVAPEKPFGSGALWFRDVVGESGVTRSLPLVLDRLAAEPAVGLSALAAAARGLRPSGAALFGATLLNLVDDDIHVEADYGILTPNVAMTPIAFSNVVDFARGDTLAVSGLPTGLKYNDKGAPLCLSGTPTKPGDYTLKFTAKIVTTAVTNTQGRVTYTYRNATATASITVKPFPEIKAVLSDEAAAAGCKVTGDGNFKAGTKVTLKATAAKDWTFAGWGGVEGLAALNPSLAYTMGTDDRTEVAANFIHRREDVLTVADPGVVPVAKGAALSTNLIETLIETRSLPTVTVTGLPTGLKFDAKTFQISGTVGKTAKDGYAYVTVAAKNASGYTFTRILKFVVLAAAGDEIPEEPVLANGAGIDFSDLDDLVTGGYYPQDGLDAVAFFVNPATNGAAVASVTVNGLPTGLKSAVAVTDGLASVGIYGTPTKPGRYVLKVQVSYADRKKATSEYAFIVGDGGSGWLDVESFDAALGTVSGAGVYASGATVKLSAKPAKGNVFAGWYEDGDLPFEILAETDGVDCRAASASFLFRKDLFSAVPFALYGGFIAKAKDAIALEGLDGTWEIDPAADGELPFAVHSASLPKLTVSGLPKGVTLNAAACRFVYSSASQAQIVPGYYTVVVKAANQSNAGTVARLSIFVANRTTDVIAGLSPAPDAYSLSAGVALDPETILPEVDVTDGWKLAVAGLPTGLKLVQDKATGAYSVTGVPTKAATNTVTFTATKGKEKAIATITVGVAALPAWANGTYDGAYCMYDEDGTNAMGSVSLTVSAAGKVSGKILTGGKTYNFSSASLEFYDADAEAFAVPVAVTWSKTDAETFLLSVGHDENGVGSVFMEPTGDGATFIEAAQNVWLRKDLSAPEFATGQKQPTLNLPSGVVCKFGAKGVVTLGGKVGKVSVSGKAQTLWGGAVEGANARVVVYAANKQFEGGALCESVDVALSDMDGDGKLDAVNLK